jgi:steroid 5-alpha reductase family enzyme
MMNPWQSMLVGWGVMVVAMAMVWLWQKKTSNAGIVDVAWSFGTGAMCALLAMAAAGRFERRILIAALGLIWGCRLGVHLLIRVAGEKEDGRYQYLRGLWGDRAQSYFFGFFQIQAAWTVLFALPLYFAAQSAGPFPAWSDFAGIAVWLIAVGGEALADAQLAAFRNMPANKGAVCQLGLWRYSRHPNYFFEWLHWWAYVVIGIAAPHGWVTLAGPAIMFAFLYKVTGIPFTERQALKSRGDAYRAYQATTSAFIPWPPKKEAAA